MSAFNYRLPSQLETSARLLEQSSDYRILRRPPSVREFWVTWPPDDQIVLGILDTETTGLDPARDELIELAVTVMAINGAGQLCHIEEPRSWLEQPSDLLDAKISQITGLTDADLAGQRFDDDVIRAALWPCDILVSHNARFDRAFMARRFPELVEKPWGCSVNDMDWQAHGLGGRALPHLLFEAGFFYSAHRAGPDCWALSCLLASLAGDGRTYAAHLVDAVNMQTLRIYANGAPITVKDRLKARGYRWDPVARLWWRDLALADEESERIWLDRLSPMIRPTVERRTASDRYC